MDLIRVLSRIKVDRFTLLRPRRKQLLSTKPERTMRTGTVNFLDILMLTIRTTIIRMILRGILEHCLMGRILLRRTNAGLRKRSNACFKGDPAKATRAEQHRRAMILHSERGWQPWYHCGRVAAKIE